MQLSAVTDALCKQIYQLLLLGLVALVLELCMRGTLNAIALRLYYYYSCIEHHYITTEHQSIVVSSCEQRTCSRSLHSNYLRENTNQYKEEIYLASFSSALAAPEESAPEDVDGSAGFVLRSFAFFNETDPSFFGGFGMQPLPALQMWCNSIVACYHQPIR